jgi:hypothetical protein
LCSLHGHSGQTFGRTAKVFNLWYAIQWVWEC